MITVIVNITCDRSIYNQVLENSLSNAPIFKLQSGFRSMQVIKVPAEDRVTSIINWDTIEDHEKCINAPEFMNESGNRLMKLVKEEKVRIDVKVGEIVFEQ